MKTFRLIGMAMVAIVLGFTLSSCEKDDDNFIEVDYTQDLVGTWTCLEAGYAEALVISADGSVLSTGVKDGEFWEDLKGKIEVENNKVELEFGEKYEIEGRFEMIPGETLSLIDAKTGNRLTYRYCKEDLSKEIVGMWVCMDNKLSGTDKEMRIQTFQENGEVVFTGFSAYSNEYMVNDITTYKIIGDLFIYTVPKKIHIAGTSPYLVSRLVYTPNGTAFGDIMTHVGAKSWLRIKDNLDLANQKCNYVNTFVTNVKGENKDIEFMGQILNFSKLTGDSFDKFLKSVLFSVEFPDANTIKYSCRINNIPMSMECPIEVDGNKMTVKMSERYPAYRDIDFYTYQDKDDTQMHMYMPTYAFINFFSNLKVGVMAERGELDLNNAEEVAKIFQLTENAVETINVSFVMTKSK